MIRHIVMWRVRGETPGERQEARQLVKESFEGLRGVIPGMLRLEVGLDSSAVDYACDVVLITEFDSQAALDGYATHPEHLRVRETLGNIRTARFQVDYQVDAQAHSEAQDTFAAGRELRQARA
ncbi:stress responsive protein [Burkholderia sp. SG-MS1]|uniref:Dabb family protein n=1 Tax=Paraburkholderia sp. SG-MS1 TaxID=2023741 RepID=UPI001447384B|nr:Dabb family protein [Paraburkholderia sp. SG-MS1]NKJ47679.1 stress responsive protein [Paraburkholderia sp. SG-MS1]